MDVLTLTMGSPMLTETAVIITMVLRINAAHITMMILSRNKCVAHVAVAHTDQVFLYGTSVCLPQIFFEKIIV